MGSRLPPYPRYRDSGLGWLPQVPAHWEVRRLKYVFQEVVDRTETGEEVLLSLRQFRGLVPHNDVSKKPIEPADVVGFKRVQAGQFVLNRMRASSGMMAFAGRDGLVSPDYAVFQTLCDLDPRFLVYLMQTRVLGAEFRRQSKGLGTGTSGFLRLYTDRFGATSVPFPPLDEQRRIADFLDAHGRLTNRLIRNRRRLMAALDERKQGIVEAAITTGLDPGGSETSIALPSLRQIPQHWSAKPLKRWASINARSLPENTDVSFTFTYLDISCVGRGRLVSEPERMTFGRAPSRARRIVQQGDTIFSTVRTYLRATLFVPKARDDLIASTGFAVLSPGPDIEPEFLALACQSKRFVDEVTRHAVGVAYPAIAETRLAALKLVAPPSREEQRAILEHIASATAGLDAAAAHIEREVLALTELRERLIADAVTGALDVRAADIASPLAHGGEESFALDEESDGAEDDVEEDLDAALAEAEE